MTFSKPWILCLALQALCAFASAESITYSGTFDGEYRSAEVDLEQRGTVSYISLTELVATFGGRTTLQPDRIQVDLSGGQAWLKLNDTTVNSSLDSFDLRQPVLREGEAVLVAATDVQSLLMKGFGVDTTQRVNRAPGARSNSLGVSIDELTGLDSAAPSAARGANSERRAPRRTEIHVAIVDPGHGGDDAGYEAAASGATEKDIALAVAMRVRRALEQQLGLQVRLSRDEDLLLTGEQRVNLANRDAGDVLISLHAGVSRAPGAAGFEIFHSAPEAGLNAAAIAQSLGDALVEATATPCHGVRQARLSLFKELNMPGVLIELGYLSNAGDAAQLVDEAYQQRIAEGIAAGLAPFAKKAAVSDAS